MTLGEQPLIYIVDNYFSEDDGTWYRKWSDGWIEQGGRVCDLANNTTYAITLPLPFSNTVYTAVLGETHEAYYNIATIISKTTSVLTVANRRVAGNNTYAIGINWYACGY